MYGIWPWLNNSIVVIIITITGLINSFDVVSISKFYLIAISVTNQWAG